MSSFAESNPGLQKCIDQMHEDMRKMYGIPPIGMKEEKKMDIGPLTEFPWLEVHDGYGNEPVIQHAPADPISPEEIRHLQAELDKFKEKTLLPKTGIISTAKRIGDAERNACLDLLSERLSSGHLTQEEFGVRADKVLSAHTQDELNYLTQDLPAVRTVVSKPAEPQEENKGRAIAIFFLSMAAATLPAMAAISLIMQGAAVVVPAIVMTMMATLAAILTAIIRGTP